MAGQVTVGTIVGGRNVDSIEDAVNELELSLVTVQDIINRNADGAPFEDSYIGVNLGLYVLHTQEVLMCCRRLIEANRIVSL